MPSCPNCKARIERPQKVMSVPRDLDRQLVFVEHKIALYECHRCQLKFPVGTGRKKLKIIAVPEWDALNKKATENVDLQEKVQKLESNLQEKVQKLESNLQYLRDALNKKATENVDLREKVQKLESDLQNLKEKLVIEGLRSRQERLASEVGLLREIKSGLHEEIQAARGGFAE